MVQPKLSPVPIQRVAALLAVGLILVAVAAGYWGFVRAPTLRNEVDIARSIEVARNSDRGRILARDGTTVLASSALGPNGVIERTYTYPPLAPVTGVWAPNLLVNLPPGLESSYNSWLSGQEGPGVSTVISQLLHEPTVGHDVVTTIDMGLQTAADGLLGDRAGAIIILDPRTGDVLALVSHPTFNPNTYIEDAEALLQNPQSPLLNRVTQGLYTPGSVFKVVTLAAALATDVTRPGEVFENATGVFVVEGFPVRDNEVPPQPQYDLYHALAYSSNVTFAQLGLRVGPDRLRDVAQAFGFGEEPPIPLAAAASTVGRDAFLLDQVGLANTAYGQGELLVTPLQMGLVTAAIVNGGVVPTPRLVREIRTREGAVIEEVSADAWHRALERGVADQVREAMIVSARDGYARAGVPPGIAIGGKTGTAQLGGAALPHSWFIAFAPAEAPQIALAVMVENAGAGGDIAAPIARQLIQLAVEQP